MDQLQHYIIRLIHYCSTHARNAISYVMNTKLDNKLEI